MIPRSTSSYAAILICPSGDTCATNRLSHSIHIARGAIYLVTDKLRDIRIKFGFVVEGRERDELPEALITAVDVHQFDWRACVDGLVADTPSDDDEA